MVIVLHETCVKSDEQREEEGGEEGDLGEFVVKICYLLCLKFV